MEIKRQLNNGGSPDRKSDTEIVDGERSCGLKTRFDEMSNEEFFAMSTEVRSTHVAINAGSKNHVLFTLTRVQTSLRGWIFSTTVQET